MNETPQFYSPSLRAIAQEAMQTVVKEPTGFPNVTDSAISKNDGSLLFTISPVGDRYVYYFRGNKVTKVAPDSVNWTDNEGLHFFYFNGSAQLQHTMDYDEWKVIIVGGGIQVAELYWDAENSVALLFGDERHAFMPGITHLYMHSVFGSRWEQGGALGGFTIGNGSLDSHCKCDCGSVSFYDEDLRWYFSDGSPQDFTPVLQAPVFYRKGVTGNWRKLAANDFPFIYTGRGGYGGTRVPYNVFSGGEWTLVEASSNGYYVLTHIFCTNDVAEPVIAIQGQAEYGNLNDAQSGAEVELTSLVGTVSLFSQEAVPLGTIILQTSAVYGNNVKARVVQTAELGNYVDWRVRLGQGNSSFLYGHASLFGLLANDHPQYILSAEQGGLWASKPTSNLYDGRMYFDTGLKKPFFYNTGDTTWYDAAGVAHP